MYKFLFGLILCFSFVGVSYSMTPVEFAKSMGANENLSNGLYEACKTATDPVHCFGVGLSVSNAESNMGNIQSSHGYFGLVGSKGDKSPQDRVARYKRKRYKAQDGYFFYGDRGQYPPSRYCTSEHSSNSSVGCPNGRKHFNTIRYDYKNKVIGQNNQFKYSPPLDENIEIVDDGYKKECRRVGNLEEDEYIQLDSLLGRLMEMIRPKSKTKQKLFICSN